jgi:hypothetical protein
MMRALAAVLLVSTIGLSACASSTPPPPATGVPRDTLQRVVIVGSGDTKFTVTPENAEAARTFDGIVSEVVKWMPFRYGMILAPLAKAVHSAISSSADAKRTTAAAAHVAGVSPRSVVADAFARRLEASGQFSEVRRVEREPAGDERRRADAIIRLTVPEWGLVRVREGKPDLLAAYADVHAQIVLPATGAVVWEHAEDVTHPERLPRAALTGDGDVARHELREVLERAGQQVASEFLYARGAGR